jgi:hypothetical protein
LEKERILAIKEAKLRKVADEDKSVVTMGEAS